MKTREEADAWRAKDYWSLRDWRTTNSLDGPEALKALLAEVRADERERLAVLFDLAALSGVTPIESDAAARVLRAGKFET